MRWGKGIKPARAVEDFVNVRDLAPTCMEIACMKPHAQMTGKSLAADLAFAPTLDEMRYTMMRLLKEDGDPHALGKRRRLRVAEMHRQPREGLRDVAERAGVRRARRIEKKPDEAGSKPGKKKKQPGGD